jgi:hypothetical protein
MAGSYLNQVATTTWRLQLTANTGPTHAPKLWQRRRLPSASFVKLNRKLEDK